MCVILSSVFKTNISEAIGNEPESEEDMEPNPLVSGRSVKRPRLCTIATNTGDALNERDNSRSAGVSTDENDMQGDLHSFKPIYIIGEWEDEREEQRATVPILMPSGSFETPRDHDLRVSGNGNNLEVIVMWPRYMTDFLYLQKFEIDVDQKAYEHHPRELPFRPYLRKLRSNADHKINSKCSISLPIQVKPDIALVRKRRRLLGWQNTVQKVLYVTLEAPDQDYAVENEGIPEIMIA